MASKLNLVVRLQHWMDSVPGQTFLNYAYSWGASIVILGALFKLTHLPGGNLMLFLGMGTEAFVFFLAAFDRPFDKNSINKDLADDFETDEEIERAEALAAARAAGLYVGPMTQGVPAGAGAGAATVVATGEAGAPTVVVPAATTSVPAATTSAETEPVVETEGEVETTEAAEVAVEAAEAAAVAVVAGAEGAEAGAPATVVGAPATVVGAPAAVVGAPATVVGAPAAVVGAPATVVGTPAVVIGAPAAVVEAGEAEAPATDAATATSDSAAATSDTASTPATEGATIEAPLRKAVGAIYNTDEGAAFVEQEAQKLASIIRMANDELLRRAQAVLSPEMEAATEEYIEKLHTLNETLAKVDEQSARLTRDSQEMENLNRTLIGINKVYDLHFASISRQVTTIEDINRQTSQLAEKIEEVNNIYTRMMMQLGVMVNPMGQPGYAPAQQPAYGAQPGYAPAQQPAYGTPQPAYGAPAQPAGYPAPQPAAQPAQAPTQPAQPGMAPTTIHNSAPKAE